MHERAAQFREQAREVGVEVRVEESPEGTKTAADAAAAVGCETAQIASSIAMTADDLVVVVTSGANRVDEARVAALRKVPADAVGMADPETVKSRLGWAIGGVPPFCHAESVPVYVDETLLAHERVWAAAGTPRAVFPIDPERLVAVSGGTVASVAEA